MRIEMAKQKALTGEVFGTQKKSDRLIMDWTGEDESALFDLIAKWDNTTGHAGINKLIDNHEFSGGKHFVKAGINKLIPIDYGDGAIRYLDKHTPFPTPAYTIEGINFQGNIT